MTHFKGKQFKKDVIIVAVGYYLRYNLSYREVQELLYDRGINVCHTTIYRWVQEYSKVLYYLWKKKNRQSFYSWKMDETYIKIKGRWHYLYRAIDADGLTLDTWLRKKRDTQAAYAFLKRLHKQFGEPKAIVTDKAPSLGSAFRKLQSVGLYTKTEHRTVKYLNNLIEQDHRPIKRRNKANLYQELADHSQVLRVVALSGGYETDEANEILSQNDNVIASFSRALTQDLSVNQSDADFDAKLKEAVDSIYEASVVKN
ncbi:transposase [Enterococcus faecium EnGen0150]|nr:MULTISPECIES: IS6 family transposase [Enterococcus]ELA83034.1 transposase [Enterococcus faecium EnGen0021]ELB22901.1 transposase [Enterococcus faecium EnGen0040]EOF56207.1 transposase [Enterococcus faecium EnGen0124]EOF59605.1 transposase [Enterococcus faecium EnGen0133]EOF63962.1 transposase [Enterococcus faecium EnGen0135]